MTGDDAAGMKQAAASGPRSQSQRMVSSKQASTRMHAHEANIMRYKGSCNPPTGIEGLAIFPTPAEKRRYQHKVV